MMEEDNPDLKPEEILAHALHAKNSLVHVFSLYQLAFGQLPNIPGLIDCATPPMLEDNMNALYAARQAYIKNESDSKIKLTLESNLRRCTKDLQQGEWIYYKQEDEKWKGPAEIIGIDGKSW